jgi:thioesterase domain-containing protein
LFLFHPAGGSVLSYVGLCRLLPTDRRCYGLQSPEFGQTEPAQGLDVGALARLYGDEIRSVWPDGPYMLAGWSMGGLLAFEAAQQLTQLGAQVPFVGLIDAGPASAEQAERIASRDDADLLLMQAHYVAPDILRELEELPGEARFERALEIARAHHVFPPDLTVEHLRGRIRLHRRNALAHAHYNPQPFGGIVDLFRAAGGIEAGEPVDMGWQAVAGDRLRVHVVPGEHFSLPYPPSVTTLAARLATCLAAAEARITPLDVAVS